MYGSFRLYNRAVAYRSLGLDKRSIAYSSLGLDKWVIAYVDLRQNKRAIAYSSPKPDSKAFDDGNLWLDSGTIAHRVFARRLISNSCVLADTIPPPPIEIHLGKLRWS